MAGIEKGIDKSDEASSKALVLKLYGDVLGPKLAFAAGYGRKYDWRKVLEPTDATIQCNQSGHTLRADTRCYLCGLLIPRKPDMAGSQDELWPECEHVLPLTEGRWLLDIFMSKRQFRDAWSITARTLEYDQSHRVCNQAKSNLSFIVSGPPARVSDDAIRAILNRIKARAAANLGKGYNHATMRSIAEMDVEARLPAIRSRVQQLVDHINTAPFQKKKGAEGLVTLMRASFMVDPNSLPESARAIHDDWYKNSEAIKQQYASELTAFADDFTREYPQLGTPEAIADHLVRLLPPQGQTPDTKAAFEGFLRSVAPQSLFEIIKAVFDAKRDHPVEQAAGSEVVDPQTTVHMLNLVMYGIFATVISRFEKREEAAKRLYCIIVQRMRLLADLPGGLDARGRPIPPKAPTVVDVFGPPPPPPDYCAKYRGETDRELREFLRASNDEVARGDAVIVETLRAEIPTALNTFYRTFFGSAPPQSEIDRATARADTAMRTFLDAFPERYFDAQRIAARSYVEYPAVALQLLRYGIPADVATEALVRAMSVYSRGARRRKTHRRRKARKTLRKRVRA